MTRTARTAPPQKPSASPDGCIASISVALHSFTSHYFTNWSERFSSLFNSLCIQISPLCDISMVSVGYINSLISA